MLSIHPQERPTVEYLLAYDERIYAMDNLSDTVVLNVLSLLCC